MLSNPSKNVHNFCHFSRWNYLKIKYQVLLLAGLLIHVICMYMTNGTKTFQINNCYEHFTGICLPKTQSCVTWKYPRLLLNNMVIKEWLTIDAKGTLSSTNLFIITQRDFYLNINLKCILSAVHARAWKKSPTWCVTVFMNPQTSIEIWLHYTSELFNRKFNVNVSSCSKPRKSNLTFLF